MMKKHSLGTIFVDANDVIRMTFDKDSELLSDHIIEFYLIWEDLCSGQKHNFLIDLRGSFADIPYEFLEQMISHSSAVKLKKAEAIIVDSLSLRLMVNAYKKMAPSKFPVKIFTDEKEALKWLKEYS